MQYLIILIDTPLVSFVRVALTQHDVTTEYPSYTV